MIGPKRERPDGEPEDQGNPPEESCGEPEGGKAAARLREQLQRETGEVPTESPSEAEEPDEDGEEEEDARTQ